MLQVQVILQLAIEDAVISFSMYENKPSQVVIENLRGCEFFMFSPGGINLRKQLDLSALIAF
jgi:hypothetical protein